jgi:hypothetical protein
VHNHWLFAWNVAVHWVAAMSSIVSFTLGIVESLRDRKTEGWIFFAIAALFLVFAFDQAWQDEHRNSTVLTSEKSMLSGENSRLIFLNDAKDRDIRRLTDSVSESSAAIARTQLVYADLGNRILDISKPERLKTKALPVGWIHGTENPNKARYTGSWIVITNRIVTPVLMMVTCDKPVVDAFGGVMGSTFQTSGAGRGKISDNKVEIGVGSPAWTPSDPLLVTVRANETGINCEFTEE